MLIEHVLNDLDLPEPEDRIGNPIRGSRLGRCVRQSAYALWPDLFPPEPLRARAKLVFRFGDMIHELVRREFRRVIPGRWGMEEARFYFRVPLSVREAEAALAKADEGSLSLRVAQGLPPSGPEPGSPLTLNLAEPALYVPIHVDGIAELPDGRLAAAEIKSMPTTSFRFTSQGEVEYGYRVQQAVAVEATGLEDAVYVAMRKDTCHLLELVYSKRAAAVVVTVTKTSRLVDVARAALDGPAPPISPDGDWEAIEVQHPFEPLLLEQARRRAKQILLATPGRLPPREYGPSFGCAKCAGVGSKPCGYCKGTGLTPKRGRVCGHCGGTLRLECAPCAGRGFHEEAALPWQCSYAVAPDTPILLADLTWAPAGKLHPGDRLFAFDEHTVGRYRRTKAAVVLHHGEIDGAVLEITTTQGVIRCSPEHPWLTILDDARGRHRLGIRWTNAIHWRDARDLRPGMSLSYLCPPESGVDYQSDAYLAGYVRGLVEGNGTVQRGDVRPHVRVALVDAEPLDRLEWALHAFGVATRRSAFNAGHSSLSSSSPRPMERVLFGGRDAGAVIQRLLAWPLDSRHAAAGYLAGIFDAEGSIERSGSLRIHQRIDSPVLARVVACGSLLGLPFRIEAWRRGTSRTMASARLYGEPMTPMLLRFFAFTQPAMTRKRERLFVRPIRNAWVEILSIVSHPRERLINIETSAKTFVAGGFASHNCPAVRHCWERSEAQARLVLTEERPQWLVRRDRAAQIVVTPPERVSLEPEIEDAVAEEQPT